MQGGTQQSQPASGWLLATLAVCNAGLRGPLARLMLLAAALFALAAESAHAITFAGSSFGVGNAPQWVAVAEFNGDSDPDLAIVNEFSHNVSIMLGDVGAGFQSAGTLAVGTRPLSLNVGNFNGDSDPDLVVANESDNTVSVFTGGAGGSFAGRTDYGVGGAPQAVAVANFNGDSDPDLAVINEATNDVSVLLGGAGASFAPMLTTSPVGTSPRAILAGDFNGDSKSDLASANELSNDVSVLLGAGDGTFAAPINLAVGSSPTSLTVGNFNGDSDPDLAVANELSHTISVLLGASGAGFTGPLHYAAGTLPDTVAVGNFNGDTDPDLVVANQGADTISLLFGGAGGSFSAPSNFAAGDGPTSVATGDFNGDSDQDIAVAVELVNSISILVATPPETTITSGPAALTNDSTPTLTFASGDPSATFRCRVDSASFSSCSSPHTTSALSEGAHVFEVRATDDVGKTDPTPASTQFTVDTVAPAAPTLSTSDPASPANDNAPRLKGTAAAGSSVSLFATQDCSGASLAFGPAATFSSQGLQVAVPDNSTTTFRAKATDLAGNASGCSASSLTYEEVSPPTDPPPPPPAGGTKPPVGGAPPADTTAPVMALAAKSLRIDSRGAVSIPVACPASEQGGCSGKLSLDSVVRVGGSRRNRSRKQRVKFGKGAFQVAGGRSTSVRIRLSRKHRLLVARLTKVEALVTMDARDAAGNARTTKVRLTLKAAKRSR